MKPTLFPLLPLPEKCRQCRCRVVRVAARQRLVASGRRKLNYRLKRTPVRTSCTTSSVMLVRVVFVVVSMIGAAAFTSTTVELEPTSSLKSTEGRWPTSMTRPSRLAVEKPLAVMTRV